MPANRSAYDVNYLVIHENGEATGIVKVHNEGYNISITCYSINTGHCRWTKKIPTTTVNWGRAIVHLREFPALKSIVIATDRSFTIISNTGELVSHPQPIVVDGVFRTISTVTVHNDTVIIGLTDGRICCFAPAMLSLVQLCARQIIMANNTRQIDEICKRAPHDIVVRLEEAYYQYK